ncbi:uncharacterized protein LOC112683035 isoform X2 [Sipha flava]|uniref:Uncharacterized protein LOC112683035 isoform X2 n=1 Tax=Sipha flava TaxID=143950 RepID=A0A2S2QEN5_9HEMI|nr:uncharacterized protein LOC112683035 isoform X2 [Sipha flava]
MNFDDMHVLAKRIDSQIRSLETKVSDPMSMMYSNIFGQGVKVLSMLKDTIENIGRNKKEVEHMIQEENSSFDCLLEDFNTVNRFKSEVEVFLNDCENTWSSSFSDYKPFISYDSSSTTNKGLNGFSDLSIQDDIQIADQSLNDSLNNITMS